VLIALLVAPMEADSDQIIAGHTNAINRSSLGTHLCLRKELYDETDSVGSVCLIMYGLWHLPLHTHMDLSKRTFGQLLRHS
jgi:hypothetical protein